MDGRATATSMSVPQWRDEERATLSDSPKRARPPGCAIFSPLRSCSSVIPPLRDGYASSSRLAATKNRQQRGMAEFLKRLPYSIARKEKWRPLQSPARQSPRTATSACRLLLPRREHTKRDQMIGPESGPCAKTRRNAAESGESPPDAWYRA